MLDQMSATISSYLGHFRMANTYHLCKSFLARYPFLSQYFDFDMETRRLIRKYKYPGGIRRTSQQYLYYRWRFKGDVLLFQVGRFFEFYHVRDKETANLLGLSKMRKNKRGARYGFPINLLDRYIQLLLQRKVSITLVLERARYLTGIKERAPAYRFEPLFTCD